MLFLAVVLGLLSAGCSKPKTFQVTYIDPDTKAKYSVTAQGASIVLKDNHTLILDRADRVVGVFPSEAVVTTLEEKE